MPDNEEPNILNFPDGMPEEVKDRLRGIIGSIQNRLNEPQSEPAMAHPHTITISHDCSEVQMYVSVTLDNPTRAEMRVRTERAYLAILTMLPDEDGHAVPNE